MNTKKDDLRKYCRALRQSLTDSLHTEISEKIVQNLLTLPQLQTADAILTYAPIGREVQISSLSDYAAAHGIDLFYPKCDTRHLSMRFFEVRSPLDLQVGTYGIAEPLGTTTPFDALLFARPVVLVPGLAFGRDGHRLGYGRGYYDRFLRSCPMFCIGAVMDTCYFDTVPHGDTDYPVDAVVTEKGVFPGGQSVG